MDLVPQRVLILELLQDRSLRVGAKLAKPLWALTVIDKYKKNAFRRFVKCVDTAENGPAKIWGSFNYLPSNPPTVSGQPLA